MPASVDLLDMLLQHFDEMVQPAVTADEIDAAAFGGNKHNMSIHFLQRRSMPYTAINDCLNAWWTTDNYNPAYRALKKLEPSPAEYPKLSQKSQRRKNKWSYTMSKSFPLRCIHSILLPMSTHYLMLKAAFPCERRANRLRWVECSLLLPG